MFLEKNYKLITIENFQGDKLVRFSLFNRQPTNQTELMQVSSIYNFPFILYYLVALISLYECMCCSSLT